MKVVLQNHLGENLSGNLENNGPGILAILVHGFKGNKDVSLYKNIESNLKKRKVSSLRFDFSGCGESEGNYSDSTFDKQVKELNLIISKMDSYKKVMLIGHSMGCAVSLMASGINPKVCGIVLMNPLVFPYITFNDSIIKFSPFVLLSKFNPNNIRLPVDNDGIKKTKEKVALALKRHVTGVKLFEEMKTLDLISIAKESRMPALIIHGKSDELIPISHAEYLNYNLKNSNLVVFDYPHYPFLKRDVEKISNAASKFALKLKEKFLK